MKQNIKITQDQLTQFICDINMMQMLPSPQHLDAIAQDPGAQIYTQKWPTANTNMFNEIVNGSGVIKNGVMKIK